MKHDAVGKLDDPALWTNLLSSQHRGVEERRDIERMRRKWPVQVKDKRLINLGVPDEFAYMEGRLVKLLVRRLARYIGEPRKPL